MFIYAVHTFITYMHVTYIRTYVPRYVRTDIHILLHVHTPYLPACMPACVRAYVPTYIHTYIRTYIHAYIHTYKHKDISDARPSRISTVPACRSLSSIQACLASGHSVGRLLLQLYCQVLVFWLFKGGFKVTSSTFNWYTDSYGTDVGILKQRALD